MPIGRTSLDPTPLTMTRNHNRSRNNTLPVRVVSTRTALIPPVRLPAPSTHATAPAMCSRHPILVQFLGDAPPGRTGSPFPADALPNSLRDDRRPLVLR